MVDGFESAPANIYKMLDNDVRSTEALANLIARTWSGKAHKLTPTSTEIKIIKKSLQECSLDMNANPDAPSFFQNFEMISIQA